MDTKMLIELTRMKLDILKMKADDYNWQCHTPKDVRQQLEDLLVKITKSIETGYVQL